MIQNVLRDLGGVGIYGAISISLFFLVFSAMLWRVCRLRKSDIQSMQALPLEDDPPQTPIPFNKGDSRHD